MQYDGLMLLSDLERGLRCLCIHVALSMLMGLCAVLKDHIGSHENNSGNVINPLRFG
jgi:hypothetical protein